ncbi:MAG: metal-binding protein [Nitrospirae bacterium]|nr:metal-binding protein [Nitrospirota bacterium]
MDEARLICDLCALEIAGSPFTAETADGKKCFCCEGCLGIYKLMFDID